MNGCVEILLTALDGLLKTYLKVTKRIGATAENKYFQTSNGSTFHAELPLLPS
jgi:hypothetical protein